MIRVSRVIFEFNDGIIMDRKIGDCDGSTKQLITAIELHRDESQVHCILENTLFNVYGECKVIAYLPINAGEVKMYLNSYVDNVLYEKIAIAIVNDQLCFEPCTKVIDGFDIDVFAARIIMQILWQIADEHAKAIILELE